MWKDPLESVKVHYLTEELKVSIAETVKKWGAYAQAGVQLYLAYFKYI